MRLLIDIGTARVSEQQFAAFVQATAPAPLVLKKSATALYALADNARTARASISSAVHAAAGVGILAAEFVAVRGPLAKADMSGLRIGVVAPVAAPNTLLGDQVGGVGLELFWNAASGAPRWHVSGVATPALFTLPAGFDRLDFYNAPIRLELDLDRNVITVRTGQAFASITPALDLRDCFLAASTPVDTTLYMNSGQSPWNSASVDDGAARSGWFLPRAVIDPLRVADRSFLSGPADEPPNAKWEGRIAGGDLSLKRALRFWPWSATSGVSASQTTLSLNNADGGLDVFSTTDCRYFPATLREVSDDGVLAGAAMLAALIVSQAKVKSDGAIDITLTDAVAKLEDQLQHRIYDDTAPSGLAGKPAPFARGVARSLPVGVLDAEALLFAFDDAFFGNGGDGSRAASPVAMTLARDKGYPLYSQDARDTGDGTLTLARPPVGAIVCDVAPADGQPLTLENFVLELLVDHAGFAVAEVAAADLQRIDSACGYNGGFGYFLDSAAKVSTALAEALDTHYSCIWRDAAGNFRATRLVAPESLAARKTLTGVIERGDMLGDLTVEPDLALNLTTVAQGARNYATISDFATDEATMTPSLRADLSADYRITCRYAGPLADIYAAARNTSPVGTLLDSVDDVQAFVDYGGELYSVPRYFSTVQVRRPAVRGIELGQVWRLIYPRYGLDDGVYALVTGITDGLLDETVTVTLWHSIGIDVLPDPLVLLGAFAPAGVAGDAYSSDLIIMGGSPDYTNARALAGALPDGLALSILDDRLILSGTPAQAGSYLPTVAVDSGDGQTAASQQAVNIAWPHLMLDGEFAAYGSIGIGYQSSVTVSGGNGAYLDARIAGTGVPGLAVEIMGDQLWLLGLAGAGGVYRFEVSVDSADGQTATQAQTIIASIYAQTTHLVYDGAWRLSKIIEQTIAGGSSTTLNYDAQDRVESITGAQPMTVYYDAQGRVSTTVEQIDSDPSVTIITYDTDGGIAKTETTWRGAMSVTSYGYSAGRVDTITDSAGTATINYDGAGRVTEITGGETPMTVSYDDAGRVSEVIERLDGDASSMAVSYADDNSVAQTETVYRDLTSTADLDYDTGHIIDIIVTETAA